MLIVGWHLGKIIQLEKIIVKKLTPPPKAWLRDCVKFKFVLFQYCVVLDPYARQMMESCGRAAICRCGQEALQHHGEHRCCVLSGNTVSYGSLLVSQS